MGILGVIGYLSSKITYNFTAEKFIQKLYKPHKGECNSSIDQRLLPTKFTVCEKLYEIGFCKCFLFCFKRSKLMKNHALYKDFHEHFCEDIDIINILSKL